MLLSLFFFSSRRRHTRWLNVTGVQTCALPICGAPVRRLSNCQTRRQQLNWRDVDVWEPHTDEHSLAFVPTSRDGRQRLALTGPGRFCLPNLTADERRWTRIAK